MNNFKVIKETLISGLLSLLFFSIGFVLYKSVQNGELELMGMIFFMYFLFPIIFYSYVLGIARSMAKVKPGISDSWIPNVLVSALLSITTLTIWVLLDGGQYRFNGIDFYSYWVIEFKRYWIVMLYFTFSIPSILWLWMRFSKR